MAKRSRLTVTDRVVGTWVQTERAAHEAWAQLSAAHPRASSVLHILVASMEAGSNCVVLSQEALAKRCECSVATVKRALTVLRNHRWIDVTQIGQSGTVKAYHVTSTVAWAGPRDGRRHAVFSATVIAYESEQPGGVVEIASPLRRLPATWPDERQLPAGDGLDPSSSSDPILPHLDLPNTRR